MKLSIISFIPNHRTSTNSPTTTTVDGMKRSSRKKQQKMTMISYRTEIQSMQPMNPFDGSTDMSHYFNAACGSGGIHASPYMVNTLKRKKSNSKTTTTTTMTSHAVQQHSCHCESSSSVHVPPMSTRKIQKKKHRPSDHWIQVQQPMMKISNDHHYAGPQQHSSSCMECNSACSNSSEENSHIVHTTTTPSSESSHATSSSSVNVTNQTSSSATMLHEGTTFKGQKIVRTSISIQELLNTSF
ncbi:hypothetical protein C9374_000418 [Naegleria lovaniensis]|uniref:Uncharacterized protein n=1 Tax=Naegleria lovaniensis TaxID=51637 RepID=A0AA88KNP9_NAELO|nr:uncharacterized protein C9374_000418 [Naegleria lovaniensis]KAG2388254.1 hypothetical protein C9374_000418 [Naegleria lovaniensis]